MRSLAVISAVVPVLSLFVSAQWSASTAAGVDANLRGISISHSAAGKYTVWASGTKGTVLRSSDEGKSWEQLKIDGADDLDFRDIEAFGAHSAYAMSSGDGEKSRIYRTTNDGTSWTLQYTDKRAGFFLDSLACDSTTHCFALSDPVDGKFLILTTSDGEHWRELPRDKMPAALPAEGGFSASGTSIALCGKNIYFGTGGPAARVFHSADRGRSWTAVATPMASGNASSGIFSIACRGSHLVAVGGNYQEPAAASKVAAYSSDSGTTWHLADQQPGGYRSGVVFLSGKDFAAVGPNGTDVSRDAGAHWSHAEALNLNAAAFAAGHGWAVGPKGVVAHFSKSSP